MKLLRIGAALSLLAALSGCGDGGGSTTSTPQPPPAVPSAPGGLTATATSSSAIALTWSAAPAEQDVVSYRVLRNGNAVATVNANTYSDTGLFAETSFSYAVVAVNAAGASSPPSAAAAVATRPFVVQDVAVGSPTVSYANVELTGDGRYMVWFEQATDGSNQGVAWHCAVDPDTAALTPPDCKGFRAFEGMYWGRANPGRDAQGSYYVGMDRSGRMVMVRPTGATTGTTTVLATPADLTRRAIYASDLPDANEAYVFWIKNESVPGSGLNPANTWFELQYISLADPADVRVIERQAKPANGMPPMDIGFARWYRGKAALTYGVFGAAQCGAARNVPCVQVRQFDVRAASRADVTSDANSKVDPFPLVFDGDELLLAGVNAEATSHVYRRTPGAALFSLAETLLPTGTALADAALAQSHESIVFDRALYSAYQVNERGAGFFDTTFANTGEIWLSTVLDAAQRQWRLSVGTDAGKSEPEPFVGRSRVWVFYSSLPKGANFNTSIWQLRRAETPIGKR